MFSLISLSRDRPESLRNHLESIIQQEEIAFGQPLPWEWVILDDSLDNKQQEVIKEVCQGKVPFRNVRVFKTTTERAWGGEGTVINFGIKQTVGNWICVTCGDDVFPPYHLSTLGKVWLRKIISGMTDFAIGWAVYNLKENCKTTTKEVGQLDLLLELGYSKFILRADMSPDWGEGLYILDNFMDDRALYPRRFLYSIMGWPEWRGSWWRDEWMRRLLRKKNMQTQLTWDTWSFHQGHYHRESPYNSESKKQLEEEGDWVEKSNKFYWGQQEMEYVPLKNVEYTHW